MLCISLLNSNTAWRVLLEAGSAHNFLIKVLLTHFFKIEARFGRCCLFSSRISCLSICPAGCTRHFCNARLLWAHKYCLINFQVFQIGSKVRTKPMQNGKVGFISTVYVSCQDGWLNEDVFLYQISKQKELSCSWAPITSD